MKKEKKEKYYRKRILIIILFLVTTYNLKAFGVDSSANFVTEAQNSNKYLRVLEQNSASVTFEFTCPDFQIEKVESSDIACGATAQTFSSIKVKGFGQTNSPGKPALPTTGALIAVPYNLDEDSIQLILLADDYEEIIVDPVYPVPKTEIIYQGGSTASNGNQPVDENLIFYQNQNFYQGNSQFYPSKNAYLDFSGFIRDQKIVKVAINPFQFLPKRNLLRIHKKMILQLDFPKNINSENLPAKAEDQLKQIEIRPESTDFEAILKSVLLNYQDSHKWRAPAENTASSKASDWYDPDYPHWKILIDEENESVYRIIGSQLLEIGININQINPTLVQIFNQGKEVAIEFIGEDDYTFNPEDYFQFYAQPNRGQDQYLGRYTEVNVYWLTWGKKLGLRMGTKVSTPALDTPLASYFENSLQLEQDHVYDGMDWNEDGDDWSWTELGISSSDQSITIDLPIPKPPTVGTGKLLISVKGKTTNCHYSRIYLNDTIISEGLWFGDDPQIWEIPFSTEFLIGNDDTLTFEEVLDCEYYNEDDCPGLLCQDYWDPEQQEWVCYCFSSIYLNWIKVITDASYTVGSDALIFREASNLGLGWQKFQLQNLSSANGWKVWELTNPYLGQNLIDFQIQQNGDNYSLTFQDMVKVKPTYYLAFNNDYIKTVDPENFVEDKPSELKNPKQQADVLIISHPSFLEYLQPLVDLRHRSDQNYEVSLIDVTDIYDEFGYGIYGPFSIKSFIDYAYHNWQPPAPSYVILVGDACSDHKHLLPTTVKDNYVPTYDDPSHDTWFVRVSGDDYFPDLAIGRISVETPAELQNVLDKIMQTETEPVLGDWFNKAVLVAGGFNDSECLKFNGDSDQLANNYLSPSGMQAVKVYKSNDEEDTCNVYCNCYEQIWHPYFAELVAEAFNQGSTLGNFFGHGAGHVWDCMFCYDDLGLLENFGMYPFITSMTCYTGAFQNPLTDAFAEGFLKIPNAGTNLFFGSSLLGYVSSDWILVEAIYKAVFQDYLRRAGQAITAAKIDFLTQVGCDPEDEDYPEYCFRWDISEQFQLFGDPLSPINLDPIPPKPQNLAATADANTIYLTWSPSYHPRVVNYLVYYDYDEGFPYHGKRADQGPSPIKTSTEPNFTLSGLQAEKYHLALRAVTDSGDISHYSDDLEISLSKEPALPGDVNFNQQIDPEDAAFALDIYLGCLDWNHDGWLDLPTPPHLIAADFCPDGSINPLDALAILKEYLNYEEPCQQ